jgi:hypothetical protein
MMYCSILTCPSVVDADRPERAESVLLFAQSLAARKLCRRALINSLPMMLRLLLLLECVSSCCHESLRVVCRCFMVPATTRLDARLAVARVRQPIQEPFGIFIDHSSDNNSLNSAN